MFLIRMAKRLFNLIPMLNHRAISSKTAKALCSLMADVVDGYTSSQNASISGFNVAEKRRGNS